MINDLIFNFFKKTLISSFLFCVLCVNAQQKNIISGNIRDINNVPIPGVNISEDADPKNGSVSDFDGNFTIAVTINSKITFSYVGYESQTVNISSNNSLKIILKEDLSSLDEVTIVAYGQQKKSSVIAAVTAIDPAELKTSSSNLTTALAGRVAGVIAYQRSGEPGRDNAEFFIRGVSTFGYARSPLILIDGIETTSTDLARLQPDDIASFSIMKDATATSLYGARGANVVILVTTKVGK